ncbi:hypothetical protein [Thalassotalea sp. PLHSN55]|uniref:hypothetical protein n=1 Tax=Thalassotalea sp. PLHSN55 TaxID=3435888 RepID=UPI003F859C30
MVSSISSNTGQSPSVVETLRQQSQRNEALREQEQERLARQEKTQEEQREKIENVNSSLGQNVDINV